MTPENRRLWIDAVAADYLVALERDDFDAQERLWKVASADAELEEAFHETHTAILEELEAAGRADFDATTNAVKTAVETHLTGAEVLGTPGPVTVAMVARELFEKPPARFSADAAKLNETLLTATAELPANLELTPLTDWLAASFGAAPREYAKAFRLVALKLQMRATSQAEHQLAARRATPPKGGSV